MAELCPYCEKPIATDADDKRYAEQYGDTEAPKGEWPDTICWSMYYDGWCVDSDKDSYDRMMELWAEVQQLRAKVKELGG